MNSYISPEVILLPEPQGIDFAIQRIQVYLTNLSWIEKIFGRATIQRRQIQEAGRRSSGEETFPEVWGKNREPFNVMPNDNLKAYVFFIAHDPGEYQDYDFAIPQVYAQQRISIILWCNLELLDNTNQYRYSENLKKQVLQILNNVPKLQLTRHYEQYDEVLKEFTLTDNYKRYLKPPYYGLRIDGLLSYNMFDENVCGSVPEILPLPDFTQRRINQLLEEYAPKKLDMIVGTDTDTGGIISITRLYGFGNIDAPLALSEVEILNIIWNNGAVQDYSISGETIDFSSFGGFTDGTLTFIFRKKIPTV